MKEIKLSQGLVALVDDEDFEELNKHKWSAWKNGNNYYATRGKKLGLNKWTVEHMHRTIMNTPDNLRCDHIDGNGLNNCKSNLRNVTIRQNSQNRRQKKSSQYVGVSWSKSINKWCASMQIKGRNKYIGSYDTEIEAHNAYLDMVRKIGEVPIDDLVV